MILYLNGQDINRIVLGTVRDQVVNIETIDSSPEKYLKVIDGFLKKEKQDIENLEGILVVVGPGSATALRAILAIVNTLHFTHKIPLYIVEKNAGDSDEESVVESIKNLVPLNLGEYAEPVYAHSPRITPSKKDRLGRKI